MAVGHKKKSLPVNSIHSFDWKAFHKTRSNYLPDQDDMQSNPNYWHGSVDILMGRVTAITVKGEHSNQGDDGDDSEDYNDSIIEMNISVQEEFLTRPEEFQVIAEAIVFSLIQKRQNEGSRYSFVPTVAIKNENVYLYMYDGKYDILLKTAAYPLFSSTVPPPKLDTTTILALWFAINYKLFCTGITKEIKQQNSRANFLSSLNKEARNVYEKRLEFGRCHIGPPVERFHPRENDSVVVVEGTPDIETHLSADR
ncbi:uncharacterized protein LOC128558006 [Mercenaria mercenaria]|uniref:uncharacterized protein LOC128558006 n=1 Tax=Mercenaria mercenaria TaxID=6596 RepID=UPI00234FADA6|nr:uncharacterized protein LOC128558006 [Mercenaria mercenaria]